MRRVIFLFLIVMVVASFLPGIGHPQNDPRPKIVRTPVPVGQDDTSASLSPLDDPATAEQIREYLRVSGDMDSFRQRWIAAVDENRSLGAPYWPEEFWTDFKTEMQKSDLMPMFVTLYQHGISRSLMQDVLDAYHTLGTANFKGSPACFKLGNAELALADDMDKLKLAKTMELAARVYDAHKPQIKAARVRYMAEHPDYRDK